MKQAEIRRMRPLERKALLEQVGAMVTHDEMSLGDAARFFRSGVLAMSREEFARTVGVSHRAIASLEDNVDSNPTLDTLARVFAPFGAKVGLVFPSTAMETPSADVAAQRSAMLALVKRARRPRRAKK